jgi:Tol biopolymer transport system component
VRLGRLTWFDRDGKALDSVGPEGDYTDFRLSPDGKRLAATLVDSKTGAPEVWLTDLLRGSSFRFAFGPSLSASPIWSSDGARLVFRRNPQGETEFFEKSAAGAGDETLELSTDAEHSANIRSVTLIPTDWSPDGRNILFSVPAAGSGFELWLLPVAGDKKPVRFLQSTADAMHANFSPDGRLVAYSSNESGRFEVYVQTFPLSDRKWQVSTNGGYEPRWRADGREIYYLAEDRKLMASAVAPGPSFGVPKPLFAARVPAGVSALRTNYVPAGDGRRFLINALSGEPPRPELTVVLNWNSGR